MFSESQANEIRRIAADQIAKQERLESERHSDFRERLYGLFTATVVSTLDPLKMGGIRWYNGNFVNDDTLVDGLPWAYPVSTFGGFDDSGSIWVPPAGSRVVIFFQNGDRNSALYIGTIWDRHRGYDLSDAASAAVGAAATGHLPYWNYPDMSEYDCIWSGRRNGYNIGGNGGDQVLPPWNTEMYNGFDNDSLTDFYNDQSAYASITNPNIYGMKTNGKHGLKFVDGDPLCNYRYKRLSLFSGRGNWLMFKDDHLHTCGQWAWNGLNEASIGDNTVLCHNPSTNAPYEDPCCTSDSSPPPPCVPKGCMPKTCPQQDVSNPTINRFSTFANPFFKRQEEMRPYVGPVNVPQQNTCQLHQSGIQMQSLSGHQMVFDDSVNQPTGVPTWDRDFDFGCDDLCKTQMFMRSATGHILKISDEEDFSKVRGEDNGISFRTANGVFMELNDHTMEDVSCVPQYAGDRRGITMMTTSTHLFQMNDSRLQQTGGIRKDGGIPKKADQSGFKGYCLLRSGYGLQLLMSDDDRQDQTARQFIQIMSPQISNVDRGPHMMVFQEAASGPGTVMLRAGGVYYQTSYDASIEVVGDEVNNPADKFVSVTNNYLVDVKEYYFNHSDLAVLASDTYIFLMAGNNCQAPDNAGQAVQSSVNSQNQSISNAQAQPGTTAGQSECGPCMYNVIVSKDPWVCPVTGYVHYGLLGNSQPGAPPLLDSRSTGVFASAVNESGSQGCTNSQPDSDSTINGGTANG